MKSKNFKKICIVILVLSISLSLLKTGNYYAEASTPLIYWNPDPVTQGDTVTFSTYDSYTTYKWWKSDGPGNYCTLTDSPISENATYEYTFYDNGDWQVCFEGTDGQGGVFTDSQTIIVNNHLPDISSPSFWTADPEPSDVGSPFYVALAFTDYEDSGFSCTIDYGDDTGEVEGIVWNFVNNDWLCTGPNHTYTSAGEYDVQATVYDSYPDSYSESEYYYHVVNEVVPTTLLVNASNDNNDGSCNTTHCSLREAITVAASGDSIMFAESLSGATITLGSPLVLDKNLIIDGSELVSKVSISGNNAVRVFTVVSGNTVALNSLIITGGKNDNGGGIYNGGTLAIHNSSLVNNSGTIGAGINNNGTLSITNSTLSQNNATNGGGLTNWGVATLTGCTLSENGAEAGAGIDQSGGTLTVTDSTISGNTASIRGGGLIVAPGVLANVYGTTFLNNTAGDMGGGGIKNFGTTSVVNSTFTGNITAATVRGSAIMNDVGGTLTLYNSTLSGNTGYVTLNNEESMSLANTIIANTSSGWDCSTYAGTLTSSINNWVSDGASGETCGATLFGNPMLDPLADNGGPTLTMALQEGSPAIDAGDDTICGGTLVGGVDQRGVTRPQGSHCDIGSFELEPAVTTGELKITKVFTPGDSGFTGDFTIAYDCDDGTDHDGTVTLAAGTSQTISGIPIGTNCTVTEDPTPSAPTGWTFGTPTFSPETGVVTVSEVSPTYVEVVVTNTISQEFDILPDILPVGTVGFPYSQQLTAVGGTGTYTWSSSGLPTYLGILYDTGELFSLGNPLPTAETIEFTATWYDSVSSFSKNYSLIVYPALTISPEALPSGKVNEAYSQMITMSGGTAPYTITPVSLPAGLSTVIDADAGTIFLSGTPTTYGNFSVQIQAVDALGVKGAKTYGLWIEPERAFTWDPSEPDERESVTFTPVSGLGTSFYWRRGYDPGEACNPYGSYGNPGIVFSFEPSGEYQVCLDYYNGFQMVHESQWVMVANIAPVIYGIDIYPSPALVGMAVQGYVEYDRGPTPFTCQVNWGDGSGTESFDCGTTRDPLPPHTYTTSGTFTIQVWVTDSDGLTGTATRDLDVVYLYALPSDMVLASDTDPTPIELQAVACVGHTDLTFNVDQPEDFVGSLGEPVEEECEFYEEGAYLCRTTVLYTPPSEGYTSPFLTAFDFTVSDAQSNTSNNVVVDLYVAENSAPTALGGSATVSTVNPTIIRLRATDPDFYEVDYQDLHDQITFVIDSGPTEGTLTFSGWTECDKEWDEVNGDYLSCVATYTYTPNPGTVATTDSVTFHVNDLYHDSDQATFSLDLHAPDTLTVNATDDDMDENGCTEGHCSLREAVADAMVGDIIEFDLTYPATIVLYEGDIFIRKNLVINGPGADLLAISGGAEDNDPEPWMHDRVFTIGEQWGEDQVTVTISGLTVRDGRADSGGGVAVFNGSSLTMNDCVIGPNNIVTYAGGGIFNEGGNLTLNRCTVTGNEGTGSLGGAGVTTAYNDATTTLINSTVSGNITNNFGGGLFVGDESTVTLIHTTVSGNISNANYTEVGEERGGGAGIYIDPYADDLLVYLQNSIVAGNEDWTDPATAFHEKWPDVYGVVTSLGGNLIGDDTGSSGWLPGDMVGTSAAPIDPLLGDLGVHEPGSTPTFPLLEGSPAIDAVGCIAGVSTDQRGVKRPQGISCDRGAFEVENPLTYLFIPLILR